jgi:hypothetical protein
MQSSVCKFFFVSLSLFLLDNQGQSFPQTKKANVRLEYDQAELYAVFGGRRHHIGAAQFKADHPNRPEAVLDSTEGRIFFARVTGCGYENEGMTVFVSDVYGKRSVPILARCLELSLGGLVEFNGKLYLLITESSCGGENAFWLYDIRAREFVVHAGGEIKRVKGGMFSYSAHDLDGHISPAVTLRAHNLINREAPLRLLLPRQPLHALTSKRNVKVLLTAGFCSALPPERYRIIRTAGTRLLVAGACEDGGYEIYHNGIRGKVSKGSLRLVK